MSKYVSKDNAEHVLSKYAETINDKVDKVDGKGLSSNDFTNEAASKLGNIEAGAEVNVLEGVQVNGTDLTISNKKVNVVISGKADKVANATSGNLAGLDSNGNLTDSGYKATNQVVSGSTDLVESGAVRSAIDTAVSSAYHAAGTKTVAELTSSLLIAANEGNVYNMTDSGTTTEDFIDGQGKPIREGDNVGVAKVGSAYKFDLLSGFVDLTNYVQKSSTSGLLKNDGSVDTTITGAVSANTTAISGIKDGTSIDSFADVETALANKVDKVTGKGLSANDYTDEDKAIVDGVTDALAEKVDKDITEVLDEGVYLFRKAPADKYTCDECVVGGSVAWNQLVQNGNFVDTSNWNKNVAASTTFTVSNNVATLETNAQDGGIYGMVNTILDHKYLVKYDVKSTETIKVGASNIGANTYSASDSFVTKCYLVNSLGTKSDAFVIYSKAGSTPNTINIKNINVIDLTQALGTTIADYIYSLETATAGAGVAKLREWGFPINTYTPYNTGELVSVKTSGKKVVGKNLFNKDSLSIDGGIDDSGTIIPSTFSNTNYLFVYMCAPNTTYTISKLVGNRFRAIYTTEFPDIGVQGFGYIKNDEGTSITITTGNDAKYLVAWVWNVVGSQAKDEMLASVQLEFGSTPTAYEPYTETTHTLSPIELRGVPKLVESNLVYNGDTYESNGKVSRKYGIVDLGSLDYTYSSSWNIFGSGIVSSIKLPSSNSIPVNAICSKYILTSRNAIDDKCIAVNDAGNITIKDTSLGTTDPAVFKAAMSGVMLIYELATPTTETADTYANAIAVDPNGTEEWIDDRVVPVPVGHKSKYGDNKFAGDILGMTNVQERVDKVLDDNIEVKSNKTDIAYVESGTTASRAYSEGDLVYVGGVLYKVLTAISSGQSFTIGTNVAAMSVIDRIREVDTQLQLVGGNARRDITSRLGNLSTAIAERNLEKYGYKIGDYFTGASGYTYCIADLDTFYGGYNNYATVDTHHVGIVVNTRATSKWNETGDISNVNYIDSTLHTFLLSTALNIIKSDLTALFGSWENHLVKHDKLYSKIGTWGWSSASTQREYISALTECQVYGCPIWSVDNYQQGEGTRQLELFRRHTWMRVFGNVDVWLRSIAKTSAACYMSISGEANNHPVTNEHRVAGLILFK